MSNETKLYLMLVGTFVLAVGATVKGATNEMLLKKLLREES